MKKRHLGIEALRIWAMFCILFGHLMAFGGVIDLFPKSSVQQLFLYFVVNILNVPCALNSFALVSGYMGYASFAKSTNAGGEKIKWEHFLRLEFQALFFTVGITLVFFIFAPHLVGRQQWLKAVFPVTSIHYWYLSAYMPLLICSPLLFAAVQALQQKTMRQMLGICFILLSILSQIPVIGHYSAWLAHDFSPHWLAFCFFLGAYLQRYGFRSLFPSIVGRIPHKRKMAFWAYLVCVICFWFFVHALPVLMLRLFGISMPSIWRLASYKSPLSVIGAMALFYFFLKTHLIVFGNKEFCKSALLWLSSGSFAVYLLHENELVKQYVVASISCYASRLSILIIPLIVLIIAMFIYIIASLLDSIRKNVYIRLTTIIHL